MQTLGELLESFRLYGVCAPCERMHELPLGQLIQRLGANTPIVDVRQRLRCQQCRRRCNDIRIVYTGPNNKTSGFHYGNRRPNQAHNQTPKKAPNKDQANPLSL